jgi:hypothetical protein
MNWEGFISLLGYNDRWKKCRRLIHPWMQKTATEVFHHSQQHQARILLQRLSQMTADVCFSEELSNEFHGSVSDLIEHIWLKRVSLRMFAATLADSIYGYDVQSLDDTFVTQLRVSQPLSGTRLCS